ncbi:MAG: hypothetical protein IT378_25180 [Sandaracinaceae bacterium]|nr:hypothetical protein [Sandaracinaceae bacterium]
MSLDPQLDPRRTVREGRDLYLEINGFDMRAYVEPTFALPVLGREVKLPNPPARQRVIARHDLHHAITGYGTDYAGEAEIGMWELRAGCNTAFLWMINLAAVAIGMFVAPSRTVRAFRDAKGARSLYVDERELDTVLELPLAELRASCGVPRDGIASGRWVRRRTPQPA